MSPTATKTEMVIAPRAPQDIVEEVLDYLTTDPSTLQSCALVSKSWILPSRRHLFRTVLLTSKDMTRWLGTFPVPEDSPARHVRDLSLSIGKRDNGPKGFFEHIPLFTSVERVTLLVDERSQPLSIPSFWRLPQSATSLTIRTDAAVRLVQLRNLMAQLPNLDDLSLSGNLVAVNRKMLLGMGAALKGRFRGKLQLLNGYASESVVDTLLEVPTGLRFTEVQVSSTHECLLPTVRLAEACSETLEKLLYTASLHHHCETFERSFDFSKFPNLQEVGFGAGWVGGSLLWIHAALSTLRPATSPRLSTIQLNFTCAPTSDRSVEAVIECVGNDLRRIADEVTRIEHEFKGAVKVIVLQDPWFKPALDSLNISMQRRDHSMK